MPFAHLNTGKIYYAESGQTGLPIIFVHGSGANHLAWGLQLRALGKIARAIAIDLPGHGRSDPPGRTTVDAYRDDVLGLLDALRFERAVIVGHSLGGAIAQSFALTYPDRVAGLGLVGTGARLRVLPAILDGVLHDFENTMDLVVDYSYTPDLDATMHARALAEFRACLPQVTHGDFSACNNFDIIPRVSEIRAPTLVVCGREDRLTPVKYSEFLASKIAGARLVVIEDAGHSVMIEQAEAFNRALVEFVSNLSL